MKGLIADSQPNGHAPHPAAKRLKPIPLRGPAPVPARTRVCTVNVESESHGTNYFQIGSAFGFVLPKIHRAQKAQNRPKTHNLAASPWPLIQRRPDEPPSTRKGPALHRKNFGQSDPA